MNFELYIENLGAIEKAEITINPLTILAGENGTGKSFVTKFLYSVLNVLMRDVYGLELQKHTNNAIIYMGEIREFVKNDELESFLVYVSNLAVLENLDDKKIGELEKYIFDYKSDLDNFLLDFEKSTHISNNMSRAKKILTSDLSVKFLKITRMVELINFYLDKVVLLIKNKNGVYDKILSDYIKDELKLNFQISTLNQLINNKKEFLIFDIKNIIKIKVENNEILVLDDFQLVDEISNINRLVFFESPIYWRLSMELIENASRPKNYYLSDKISDERLTGVPKYFLDLRELLFSWFEKGEKEPFIEQCANDLQKSLNGKFNTDSYDLSFETNQGQTINKTLVSFGMTNLGILQAVLNKNIINKGSFVFIDEPESNLHPEWQAVLADILVKLAENGVFVVITTHSSDMLKALDVISQERKNIENFVSVNYFEKGGNLSDLNNSELSPIRFARSKLLDTYENLMMREYLL